MNVDKGLVRLKITLLKNRLSNAPTSVREYSSIATIYHHCGKRVEPEGIVQKLLADSISHELTKHDSKRNDSHQNVKNDELSVAVHDILSFISDRFIDCLQDCNSIYC